MEVKISFDTEKESIQDLKGLISALQDLINKREIYAFGFHHRRGA